MEIYLPDSLLPKFETPEHVISVVLLLVKGIDEYTTNVTRLTELPIGCKASRRRAKNLCTHLKFFASASLSTSTPSSSNPSSPSASSSSSSSPCPTTLPSAPRAPLFTLASPFFFLPLFAPFAPVPAVTILCPPVTPVTSLSTLTLRASSIAASSGGNDVWRRGCDVPGVEAFEIEGCLRRLDTGAWEVKGSEGRFLGLEMEAYDV